MISKNSLFVACLFVLSACGGSSGGGGSEPDRTSNSAPVVDAGLDATIRLPVDTVALDGTVSDDGRPTGATLSTAWSVQSGPAGATFGDVNMVDTSVTFTSEGTYVLELTADDAALQGSDTVTITVEGAPSVSDIAITPTDAALLSGATETFTASGTDQYGDPITVNPTWSATGGTIDQDGNYTAGSVAGAYTVTATDGALSATANVTISASPPSADAGGPYSGTEGASVALDGSASTDANNDIVDYDWDLDNDGAYDDASGVNATFAAAGSGVYTIGLRVTDADGATDADTTTVTLANVAPTANAGGPYSGDQATNIGLDGSASSDPGNDIASYLWDLDNDGAFDDATGVTAVFNSAAPGTFSVSLQVTDSDGASSTATSTVTVANVAPTADAGGPYSGDQGADIAVDGSASSDPGNDIVSYEWDFDNDGAYDDATGVTATFNSVATGDFTIGLRVTDGDGATGTVTTTVTVANVIPTADAGGPYTGDQGADIALDGSASSDPGDNIVLYEWDLDNDGAYDDATGISATFNSDSPGTFTVGLQVTDDDGESGTATTTVTVGNVAPTADAGGPYSGDQGSDIAVDGSASTDPGNDIVSYEWDLDNDGAYDDATGVTATFNSAATGDFTIGLRVTDGDGATGTATATVSVINVAPTADAGGPYSGDQGADIALDGSASTDPGNDIVSYEWDLDNDGAYDDATGVNATFNSTSTGVFTIGLQVTDGDGDSATATASVTVANIAPTADAGGPYSGDQGADIALDGSASSDPGNNIVSYEWDLDNDGAYDDASGVNATFNSTTTGAFTIGLRVTDGDGDSGTATTSVTVANVAPTAVAGGPYSGDQGADIALDASASSDPGNDIVSYAWDLDNDGSFDDATGASATFNSAAPGTFTVGLQVTDGDGDSGTDTATVTVNDIAPAAPVSVSASGDNDEVSLDWADNTEPDLAAAAYLVRRATSPGGPYTDVFGPLAQSSYLDTSAVNGTTYYYVVTAEDAAGNTSADSVEVATTPNGPIHAYWDFDEASGPALDTVLPDDGSGTLVGAGRVTGVSGVVPTDSAIDLNGSSDYVAIDNTQSLNITGRAITMAAWIYPRDGGASGGSRVISKMNNAGNGDVFAMQTDQYRLRFRLDNVDMISSHIIQLDEWVHVAMVYDGADKRIYINGLLEEDLQNNPLTEAKSDPIDASVNAVQIGRREAGGRFFNGLIDEVQIYNRALDAGEVAAIHSAVTPVDPAPGGMVFTDITETANTAGPADGGHGVMFAEVDNDSDPEYYLTNIIQDSVSPRSDFFFVNDTGVTFTEDAANRGIADTDGGSHGAVWADLDNDGDYDLFNGTTWESGNPSFGFPDNNNVYENDGTGNFTDVTSADILATETETRGVTAFDMDGDGDLDLFGVSGPETPGVSEAYLNNGSFVFNTHVGGALTTAVAMQGVVDTDYDGDGDIDILAANRSSGDFAILQNDGNANFTQVLPGPLGFDRGASDGISTADVDNDGDLDVLLSSDNSSHLFIRDSGTGLYSRTQSFSSVNGYMGGFADLDNDGWLDLVFAGDERVFMNQGDGTFASGQSVPVSGIDDPRAIAFADIEGDGDLDFAIAAKGSRNWLVRNDIDADAGNWLAVELVSPEGQAGAFGAKVSVVPAGGGALIGLREAKGNQGYLGQDNPVLHFGLGSETLVDVTVDFVDDRCDGVVTTVTNQAANQRIVITGVCPP